MQKYLYLIIVSFFLTSCYTYQRKKQVSVPPANQQESKKSAANGNIPSVQGNIATENKVKKSQQKVDEIEFVPINVQNALQPTKNYKIKVDGRAYKVIVDKWEGDTLVAHQVRQPAKILRVHKTQINAESIAEKRFSKPLSDIITVLVYAGIGVGIYMLLR